MFFVKTRKKIGQKPDFSTKKSQKVRFRYNEFEKFYVGLVNYSVSYPAATTARRDVFFGKLKQIKKRPRARSKRV